MTPGPSTGTSVRSFKKRSILRQKSPDGRDRRQKGRPVRRNSWRGFEKGKPLAACVLEEYELRKVESAPPIAKDQKFPAHYYYQNVH